MFRFLLVTLMIGFSVVANISVATSSDCLTGSFAECIDSVLNNKMKADTKTGEKDKLKIRALLKNNDPNNDLLNVPSLFYQYHQALINVHPIETSTYKEEIIEFIVNQDIAKQTDLLTELALIEAYTGDISTAKKTINHAIKNSPNDHKSIIVSYLIEQSSHYIEQTIKHLGYQLNLCNSTDLQVLNSLKLAVSKDQQQFSQTINSVPDNELKIAILLLTARYLHEVNECQFQTDLFEKQIIGIIENNDQLLNSTELGLKTKNTYIKLN